MHRVLKSIRELLYLVRRSQGGVIKAERGGERHHRISSVPRPVILDADGSKMASLAEEAGRSLAVAENVTFCSVSMSSLSRRSDVKCLTGIAKIDSIWPVVLMHREHVLCFIVRKPFNTST